MLCLFLTSQRNVISARLHEEKDPRNPSLKSPDRQLSVRAAQRLTVNVVSPVLLVSISVCSGDDKETGDDVKGSVGQPGKSNAF